MINPNNIYSVNYVLYFVNIWELEAYFCPRNVIIIISWTSVIIIRNPRSYHDVHAL